MPSVLLSIRRELALMRAAQLAGLGDALRQSHRCAREETQARKRTVRVIPLEEYDSRQDKTKSKNIYMSITLISSCSPK